MLKKIDEARINNAMWIQILFMNSMCYFLIAYIVKEEKMAINPFKLTFYALDYHMQEKSLFLDNMCYFLIDYIIKL